MGPRHEFAEILSKTTDIPADRSMPGPYIGIIIKLQIFRVTSYYANCIHNNDIDIPYISYKSGCAFISTTGFSSKASPSL